jgi:pimeloyl-ACP methyl ester carboxylesterase
MFALGIPELEQHLSGLILIGSAPDKSWVNNMAEQKKKYNLPSATTERKHYHHNPSNENFKALTLALSPYFFCPASQDTGLNILQKLPYNHLPYNWSIQAFHAGYHLQWVPQTIPTLILSGEHDVLTPLTCFTQHPLFQRDNIKCVEIANSGHFPWVENQNDVAQHIKNFIDRIKY